MAEGTTALAIDHSTGSNHSFMRTFSENVAFLEQALADAVPDSRAWFRHIDGENWWVEVASPAEPQSRKLVVSLTGSEINIGFYVGRAGVGGAPYELNADIPAGREAEALAEMARFVADLLNERLVLAMYRGWSGGRDFLESRELTSLSRESLEWIASWRGTYDWAIPS